MRITWYPHPQLPLLIFTILFLPTFAQDSPGLRAAPAVLDTFAPTAYTSATLSVLPSGPLGLRIPATTSFILLPFHISLCQDRLVPTASRLLIFPPFIAAELATTRQLHCIRCLLHPRDTHHPAHHVRHLRDNIRLRRQGQPDGPVQRHKITHAPDPSPQHEQPGRLQPGQLQKPQCYTCVGQFAIPVPVAGPAKSG